MAAPLFSVHPASSTADLKANGQVSRVRSHKGNMPSLPQTKHCPLCPAKFTRTTHLNRHLRSHTNERLHRCNLCQAEFTRSDLLSRHKRTCGDPANANKSRRKSCQACAESKVKCNLHYPCSKCISRGRECVFINDPEASRNKKLAAAKKAASQSSSPTTSAEDNSPTSSTPSPMVLDPPFPAPDDYVSDAFNSFDSSPIPPYYSFPISQSSLNFPGLTKSSGSSSTSSSLSSPRSDLFDVPTDVSGSFDMNIDSIAVDSQTSYISQNMFDPFAQQSLLACSTQGVSPSDFHWLDGSELYWTYPTDFVQPRDELSSAQTVPASLTISPHDDLSQRISIAQAPSTISTINSFPETSVSAKNSSEPAAAELDHYLLLFFSAFSKHFPLFHLSTWTVEGKPMILLRAMQACGALFVKTLVATNFINQTLASTRDALIQQFARNASDALEQVDLIMTVVLLQTIGLFHQRPDQRISSNVYHGMLVMMIRRTGLISRVGAWAAPNLVDEQVLDASWREWAKHETIKRVLFLSYLHDCCHCMYFSLSPSFQPTELDVCLPCDDALWAAQDAKEWRTLVQLSSPYGTGEARVAGVPMQRALAALGEKSFTATPLTLNPFAHFILIHTILRNLYAARSEDSTMAPGGNKDKSTKDAFAIQYALHNWLQMWLNSPDAMQVEKEKDEPPFLCNALPFYWLAQASLLAFQDETTSPSGKDSAPDVNPEGRFRLMKEWLDHIKTFLRTGDQIPTQLWDELMKIRTQMSEDDSRLNNELQGGLLSFLP